MNTEFHEGDMALELAEREFFSISWQEMKELAMVTLVAQWTMRAQLDPEGVRKAYEEMTGPEAH